jgi:hypothetical protein
MKRGGPTTFAFPGFVFWMLAWCVALCDVPGWRPLVAGVLSFATLCLLVRTVYIQTGVS